MATSDDWKWVAFFTGLGILIAGPPLRHALRRYRARDWPVVQGTVENATVFDRSGRTASPVRQVRLAYSYTVAGDYYSGEDLRSFEDQASAGRFANFSRGQQAFIRHDPKRPEQSVFWKFVNEWPGKQGYRI